MKLLDVRYTGLGGMTVKGNQWDHGAGTGILGSEGILNFEILNVLHFLIFNVEKIMY